jgi:hypothetical protein
LNWQISFMVLYFNQQFCCNLMGMQPFSGELAAGEDAEGER